MPAKDWCWSECKLEKEMIKAAKPHDSHGYLWMTFHLLDYAEGARRHRFHVQIDGSSQEDWRQLHDVNDRPILVYRFGWQTRMRHRIRTFELAVV